jgi:hypothetical protein
MKGNKDSIGTKEENKSKGFQFRLTYSNHIKQEDK